MVASAYGFDFAANSPQPLLDSVWKVMAEPKIKFYLRLLLKNGTSSVLCDQVPESATQLTFNYSFARHLFCLSDDKVATVGFRAVTIKVWWHKSSALSKFAVLKKQDTAADYIS